MDDNDAMYADAIARYGPALKRLARGYEADAERRRDLLQEIHFELWRSLAAFDKRCSLRTWVYRVAHNVGASHILRRKRTAAGLVELDALETAPAFIDGEQQANQNYAFARLIGRIRVLKPLDRQIMMLWLEGEQASSIAEIVGISAANVATKIYRIRKLLLRESREGAVHAKR